MSTYFSGKKVLVTGGAKGLGKAIASRFFLAGAQVYIVDSDPLGEQTASELGDKVHFIHADVSKSDEVKMAMERASEGGQLDVLVNNAGIQTTGTVTETSEEEWDRTISINLKGQFLCARHAIPHLLKSSNPVIVNVSSVNGIHSQASGAAYVTSKAAILGLTNSIAVDYAPHLRCVALCPGAIDTPMTRADYDSSPNREAFLKEIQDLHLLGRIAGADEVAGAVFFLAGPDASFITGHFIRVDGGLGIKI